MARKKEGLRATSRMLQAKIDPSRTQADSLRRARPESGPCAPRILRFIKCSAVDCRDLWSCTPVAEITDLGSGQACLMSVATLAEHLLKSVLVDDRPETCRMVPTRTSAACCLETAIEGMAGCQIRRV